MADRAIVIVERHVSRAPRVALDALPAACAVLLLAFRGGAWALPLALALVLACALLAPSLWKRSLRSLGALDIAALAAVGVYALSAVLGVYFGAGVPAIAHAVLALCVFRAAAEGDAKTQSTLLVGLASVAAAVGILGSLIGGGPAHAPAAWPLVNHDHLASLCALALPLSFQTLRGQTSRSFVFFRPVTSGLLATALLFTVSRAGIAAAVVPAIVGLVLATPPRRRVVAAVASVAAMFVLGAIAARPVLDRLELARLETSFEERKAIWEGATDAFRERPLLGSGAGTFAVVFPQWRDARVPYRVDHAHQEPLELAVEAGALGVAAALFFLAVATRAVWRQRSPLSTAAALGVAAVLLHGLADFPLRIPAIAVVTSWALGIAVADPTVQIRARRQRIVLAFLAAISVVTLLHAAGTLLAPRPIAIRLSPWNAGVWRAAADDARSRGLAGNPAELAVARNLYSTAIVKNPRDAHARVERGRLALLDGDHEAGLADLEAALEHDPAPPAWQLARIEGLLDAGRIEDARQAVFRISYDRPDLHAAALALLFDRLGDDVAAARAATGADPRAEAALARFLADRGHLAEAHDAIRSAWRRDPLLYFREAVAIAQRADDAPAVFEYLKSALSENSVFCESDPEKTMRDAFGAEPIEISVSSKAFLAVEVSRAAPPDLALTYARCATDLDPRSGAAWSRLAELTGEREHFRKAAELAPDDPGPLVGLARLEQKSGNLDAALEAARAAESRRTCEGTGAIELTRILDANGMRAAAVHRLQELVQRCPSSEPIANRLAELASSP